MDDLIEVRLKKLEEIRKLGIDPYGENKFAADTTIQQIRQDPPINKEVKIAGRIMSMRLMGKAAFSDLVDFGNKIQLYFRKDNLEPGKYEIYKKLIDIGDILGVEGTIFYTHTKELSLEVKDFKILCKSLLPLPEKWHGLTDVEKRYRQRYIDLIINEKTRNNFVYRFKLIKEIRGYLDQQGFLEVETPMMQPKIGGAEAKPFITHHNALDMDLYLRIAPELYLKRLVVGGINKVYELNRNFRNEGISSRHNPEFTMLEIYYAYKNYQDIAQFCEDLISQVAFKVFQTQEFVYQGEKINLSPPFKRENLYDLMGRYTNFDFSKIKTKSELENVAFQLGVDYNKESGEHKIFDHIFEKKVLPHLIQPTFVFDYPAKWSPLAKTKKDNPEIAERFELFIAQQELANAYSELNDPQKQEEKFRQQLEDKQGMEGVMLDTDYIRALMVGLPPTAGLGIGIDRLLMILTDSPTIKEVILFPLLHEE